MAAFHLHLRYFTAATSSLLLIIAILPHPINSLLLSNNYLNNYHGRVLHTPPTLLYSTSTTTTTTSTTNVAAVWQPPSQNKAKLNGHQGVFDIESPEDLLDFIIDDNNDDDDDDADDDNSDSNRSLAVIKVYASWCRTCKQFDLRYKKIVNQFSNSNTKRNSNNANNKMKRRNTTVRFANMQYDNGGVNSEICNALYDGSIDSFPYILIYDSKMGMKVDGFHCTPAKSHLLVDAIGRHLETVESSGGATTAITNMKTEQQQKSTFPNTSSGFQPTKYYLETLSSMN